MSLTPTDTITIMAHMGSFVPAKSARIGITDRVFARVGASDELAKVRGTNPEGLRRQLSGDLDWVVMRAIEKDRTRRYDTVNALAMECKRYLGREPVLARPPSAGYLLRRFMQRNKLVVAAGSIAILAIVFGAVTATMGYLRATEAERVALQEAETARQVSDFLVELFQVSDPWTFAPVRDVSGSSITTRRVPGCPGRIRSNVAGGPGDKGAGVRAEQSTGRGQPDKSWPPELPQGRLQRVGGLF